jgi:phospholipid/cholesterol/gamma-HCH transport system substrate-binding protein
MREALSENNLRNLQLILAHLEKTAGESAPLTTELRDLVKSMNRLSLRYDHLADSVGTQLTTSTLPRVSELMTELTANSRQLSRVLEGLENNPQMLLFGPGANVPGPGESGFAAPKSKGEKQ